LSIKSNYAQQEALFTHYTFNTLAVNPAYAGSRDALTATGLNRSQWVGFPDAPITQTVTVHSPLVTENLGVGVSLVRDQAGATTNSGFAFDFAYKIPFGEKGQLSFGLKTSLTFRKDDLSGLDIIESNDPNFEQTIQNQILPNLGFGLYYKQPNYYLGFSVPKILKNKFNTDFDSNSTNSAAQTRHFYLIAGTVIELEKYSNLTLKPTGLLKITNGAPVQLDLSALFFYNDLVWFGPIVRAFDAIGVLAGLNISEQFSVGYSFDWSFGNNTGRYNGGSHELLLRYDFIFNNQLKIESPRYF